jgi:hypothetical protein
LSLSTATCALAMDNDPARIAIARMNRLIYGLT